MSIHKNYFYLFVILGFANESFLNAIKITVLFFKNWTNNSYRSWRYKLKTVKNVQIIIILILLYKSTEKSINLNWAVRKYKANIYRGINLTN